MARLSIKTLKNKHAGQDAWVIAAGPSAGFIDPDFFREKLTIGINFTWRNFPADYVVIKEQYAIQEALDAGKTVVASRYNLGNPDYTENQGEGDFLIFEHKNNNILSLDLSVMGSDDHLVVSYSTITSGIHLAAFLGAENIILVGHDCGTIDGETKMPGYYKSEYQQTNPGFYRRFIGQIEPQTLAVKQKIREVYGARIYSLNPWVNLGLEGHKYER